MLPPAALHLADRLATALMALVEAVAHIAKSGSTPTLPEAAAQTLFCRLCGLVTRLIRINNFGVPTRARSKPTTKAPEQPAPIAPLRRPTRPNPIASLPRRPGWLLAALPEIAPAVAADLQALLADPATATLLAADPTLYRTLRPLLRSLGLDAAPPTPTAPSPPPASAPPPITTPPDAPPPRARASRRPMPARRNPSSRTPRHFTSYSLR